MRRTYFLIIWALMLAFAGLMVAACSFGLYIGTSISERTSLVIAWMFGVWAFADTLRKPPSTYVLR